MKRFVAFLILFSVFGCTSRSDPSPALVDDTAAIKENEKAHMDYTRIVVRHSSKGDETKYLEMRELILDTYPTDLWAADLDNSDEDSRELQFIVDDSEYAKQCFTSWSVDFSQEVVVFDCLKSSVMEFRKVGE